MSSNIVERRRSSWWYLLPIALTVVGGIIAYFALRRDDAPKAKNCLYLGIAIAAVDIGLAVAIAAAMSVLGPA